MKIIQILKRFYSPLFQNKKMLTKIILGWIVFSGYGFLNVTLLSNITSYLETSTADKFYILAIFATISLLVYHILYYCTRHWIRSTHWYKHANIINDRYMKQIIRFNNNKFEQLGVGKIIGIVEKGMEGRTNSAIEMIGAAVSVLLTLIFGLYYASTINWYAVVLYLAILIVIGIVLSILQHKMTNPLDKRNASENDNTHQLVKILMSKFEILLNNKSEKEIEILNHYNIEASKHNIDVNQVHYFAEDIPNMLINIARVFIFFYLGMGYFSGEYSLTQFTTTLSLLVVFDGVIRNIMNLYLQNSRNFSHIKQFWDLLDNTPTISNYDIGKDFVYKNGSIAIQDLIFGYNEKNIFDHINLSIKGGRKTALVGVSGSGKTTLIKLIAGYLNPLSGKVCIDGQDLSETKLTSYYDHIGYLTQEPSLFDGTIEKNLTYGIGHIPSDEELKNAIKLANCEFIYDLPLQLQTEIGEKGVRLSGGQKQRLGIAKIFLRNPKIILLDEPTAALDSMSEKLITDSLHSLFKNRTVIVIAHRLQTVRDADEIIVFEKGKVVEQGTHQKLSQQGGVYQQMIELQSDILMNTIDKEKYSDT